MAMNQAQACVWVIKFESISGNTDVRIVLGICYNKALYVGAKYQFFYTCIKAIELRFNILATSLSMRAFWCINDCTKALFLL